jgi:UDP-N-acetylglucosamine--N-acetylmuramyl-(pentapeptide) pyrophosphoryl-undecaprenol N-acetylglucosamine transferase
MTTVLVMAGGTGGHVFPALAVARVLKNRGCELVWMGTRKGIEARIVPNAGIAMEWVRVAGLRGKGFASWLGAPIRLIRALSESLGVMRRVRPDVVLGLGGFVAGPGGLAARLLGIPLVIHEQNAVAGFTNRVLARFSTVVAEAFPGAFSAAVGAQTVGNPVRSEIEATGAERWSVHTPPRLLVFGGSQGAQVLNETVPAAVALLPAALRPAVLHQTGRGRADSVRSVYANLGIAADVREFIDDMADAYAWADLAITRSGALTVAELAAAGLPAVLVPYPAAVDDHQTANARFLSSRQAAVLLPQSALTPRAMADQLGELLTNSGVALAAMSRAALQSAQLGTADVLATLCLQQAERHSR